MLNWKQRLTGPHSMLATMIATAIGAVLFTAIAGAMVYFNTQRQTSAANWVQHTQDVLSTLQRTSGRGAD
jgi:CHASE3 domain sensor protein